jgi:hypothetical protein
MFCLYFEDVTILLNTAIGVQIKMQLLVFKHVKLKNQIKNYFVIV